MGRCAVGALLVVLLAVVGCSGDEVEASADPVASVPVSGSASAPVAPEDETAEEFIRRWFAVQVKMQNTGDATEFLAMAPTCVDCRATAEYIESIFDAGGSIDYGGEQIEAIERYSKSGHTYGVVLSVQPTRYRERAGAPLRTVRGGRAEFDVTLAKQPAGWEVAELVMVVR